MSYQDQLTTLSTIEINNKYQEIKLKLTTEEVDVTNNKPYTLTIENNYSKYKKVAYNLKSHPIIRDVCSELKTALDLNDTLKSFNYFFKTDKVTIFNKGEDKDNRKFSQLNLCVKIYKEFETISVEFGLVN